ncbi:MAG: prepilin-type N-terminal cleavage/methylation domain-containing protein, partial [Fimbriimonas sp.]
MNRKAFTLIELLVVIAIIAILAAILFPVFAQAKMAAKKTADLSGVKQLSLGVAMYGNDYDDTFPFAWGWDSEWKPWHQ